MKKRSCDIPKCKNPVEYAKLKLCRGCYNRIWWISKNYEMNMEKAKAAAIELDKVAIKHGLTRDGKVFSYAHRRRG